MLGDVQIVRDTWKMAVIAYHIQGAWSCTGCAGWLQEDLGERHQGWKRAVVARTWAAGAIYGSLLRRALP